MRETLKGYGKYFLSLAILVYVILSIVLKNIISKFNGLSK